jgi:TrmH family RNA methyltransferase
MLITSRANDRVKAIRALRNRRDRDAGGAFFAEGWRVLRAAIETGAAIEQAVIVPGRITPEESRVVDQLRAQHTPLLEVTGEVFDSISFRDEMQSVGAVVRQRWETLSGETQGRRCWVALHDIQHPGNLGTIIRTCDAIGGDGVILSGRTTDPYHPVAVRGSLGSVFSQRLVRTTPSDFARWVKQSGATVVGTSPAGDADYRDVEYRTPVVLITGSERIGLSDAQRALCDAVVRIPMQGYVESLNLSIATALVLYEIARQAEADPSP